MTILLCDQFETHHSTTTKSNNIKFADQSSYIPFSIGKDLIGHTYSLFFFSVLFFINQNVYHYHYAIV